MSAKEIAESILKTEDFVDDEALQYLAAEYLSLLNKDSVPREQDWESMLNSRKWLESALKSNGAEITGSGCGMGGGDVWIELEGFEYFVTIKPVIATNKGEK